MNNNFFNGPIDDYFILSRLKELEEGKVGFYSVGLYAASLAYNCAMQTDGNRLLLAPRPSRELLGAFSKEILEGMDPEHVNTIQRINDIGNSRWLFLCLFIPIVGQIFGLYLLFAPSKK